MRRPIGTTPARAIIYLISWIIIAVLVGGCAAQASAPPLEIPAPTTGRITVGAPDAAGKAIVTGTSGAVPALATVLIVNQSIVDAAMALNIVPSVTADEVALPGICYEPAHWCVVASEDGSFDATIDASVGDTIMIALVDSEGNVGEAITITVPNIAEDDVENDVERDVDTDADPTVGPCADEGVDGSLVDFANDGGTPYALFEGDALSMSTLFIGSGAFEIPLCHVSSLAILPDATPTKVAIASAEEKTIVVATWNGSDLTIANAYGLSVAPLALSNIGSADRLALAMKTDTDFEVARLSTSSGAIDKNILIPSPASGWVIDALQDMNVVGEFNDTGHLGLLLFEGTDGSEQRQFVSFFETSNFNDVTINSTPIDITTSLGIAHAPDARLALADVGAEEVALLATDDGASKLVIAHVLKVGDDSALTLGDPIAGVKSDGGLKLSDAPLSIAAPPGLTPKRFDVGYTASLPTAYILVNDDAETYDMWNVEDFAGNYAETLATISGAEQPAFIAIDSAAESILIADDLLGAVFDMSEIW